ncbi:MAG: magnesium transporter [bacterium]|nr:magnesium transporter [bacterium]
MYSLLLFLPEIRELILQKQIERLKILLSELHSIDIAEGFGEFTFEEKLILFRCLSADVAINVFTKLNFEQQKEIIDSLSKERLTHVLEQLPSDDRADFFSELSPDVVNRLFALMKKEEVEDTVSLLRYKEDTAGGIMTTEYVALLEDITVEKAINHLRDAKEAETIFYIYVINKYNHLCGVIAIRTLIMSKREALLKDIMKTNVIKVGVNCDQEEVAQMVKKYAILAIPVTDHNNKLLGIVTVDDCIDVLEEEATEDIFKMAGASFAEKYAREPVHKIAGIRLPWLIICLVGELFSAWVIKSFNITLNEVIALAFFIPIIMAMGGNVGAQSSTSIVRGMAIGTIEFKRIHRIILKEISIGAIMGIVCGFIVGILIMFILGIKRFMLGIVVGLSIFVALFVATLIGTTFPLIFKRLNIDPAIATVPFVTTIVDITGLVIYFSLATALIHYLV